MIKKILNIALIAIIIFSCSKPNDDDSGNDANNGYNRSALLTNMADNIIIPAYQDLNEKLLTLIDVKNNFIATPNQNHLKELRSSWFNAYKTWQSVQMFQIGKAKEVLFEEQMNVYPTNIVEIENNISLGNYDLTHQNNNDAVGFPAIDYMLYGIDSDDAAILNKYTNDNYLNYLSDLVNRMSFLTNTVLNDWTSGYRNTFIANTENSLTGAVNQILNAYMFYYEKKFRVQKVGLPAGVFSSQPMPSLVEALYKQDGSKDLAIMALNAVQYVFNGKSYNNTDDESESYKKYLIALNRNDLVEVINTRFDVAREKVEALDDNFKSQVETNNTKMNEAYDAIQLVVVSLKADMLSAFDVSLSYEDNDGD